MIAPFELPPENKDRPLPFTGETVANTLRDTFSAIQNEAQGQELQPCGEMTEKQEHFFSAVVFPPNASFNVPPRTLVEVKGISVDAIKSVAREVLGHEQHITGDVVLVGSDKFQLRAREDDSGPWSGGTFSLLNGLENAECTLAEAILASTNRNLLAAAIINRGEYQRAIDLYRHMPTKPSELADAFNNLAVALSRAQESGDVHCMLATPTHLNRAHSPQAQVPAGIF